MRKLISLLLCAALVLTLAACGGNGENIGDNTTNNGGEVSSDSTSGEGGSSGGSSGSSSGNSSGNSSGSSPSGSTGGSSGGSTGGSSTPTTANGLRLAMNTYYRNTINADITAKDDTTKEIDAKADAYLTGIENYKDTITATGKTYYISANGSDSNSGTSPDKPLKSYFSLAKSGKLKSGDAVLFRRGDIFRGYELPLISGVSYGAYGTGIKPRIYGSLDGKESKWTETTTKGVYKYSASISGFSNIVFNEGEAVSRVVTKQADLTKKELNTYYDGSKIYVYCPKGNPADVYSNIEIAVGFCIFVGNSTGELRNVKVQNLAIMYAGVHGFGKLGKSYNVEIEGCVLGFHGGRDLYTTGNSLGNAIEFWGVAKDIKVHDNYIFQCFDTGITHQGTVGGGKETFDNIKYYNNLIEYCVWSIEAWEEGGDTYGEVLIEGNICRYAGWGWGSLDRPDKNVYSDIQYTRAHTGNLIIKNNIFDRSRRGTFGMRVRDNAADNKSLYHFTDNLIVIAKNRSLGNIGNDKCGYSDDYNAFLARNFGTLSNNKIVKQ